MFVFRWKGILKLYRFFEVILVDNDYDDDFNVDDLIMVVDSYMQNDDDIGDWQVNKLAFLIYYLNLFYLDFICFYFLFENYFTSIASYLILGTNIINIESWSKRKEIWSWFGLKIRRFGAKV